VRRKNRPCGTAALLLLLWLDVAEAATTTSTMGVRVTIVSSCVIRSAATLNFGSIGVIVSNVDSTSALRVQCTSGTPYNIGLNAGTGLGATVALRKMSHGTSTINYSLYTTSARTTVWGNTVGIDTVGAMGNGASQSYTVYGRVPAQTTPAPAAYTDTITVTVTY